MPTADFCGTAKDSRCGYTATAAVSEDHLIVEQRVGQNPTDNAMLVPVVEAVEQHCRERPQKVSADSGYFRLETIVELAQRGLDVYVPDSNLARELNRVQTRARSACCTASGTPAHATQVARSGWPGGLSAAQGDRGTRVRGFETTAWNATVPEAGQGIGRGGVRAGRNGLQPHSPVAQNRS